MDKFKYGNYNYMYMYYEEKIYFVQVLIIVVSDL